MTWLIPLMMLSLGLVLFLLYWNGIASVTTKRAIMFVGDAKRATFHGCTGRIRRIVRVKESGSVRFALEMFFARLLSDEFHELFFLPFRYDLDCYAAFEQ